MDSIFQLLNVEYLRSLSGYFYENFMLIELNTIVYYESNFFGMLTWIIGSFCLSILYLQRGWHKNTIYENGVLVNGKIIDWNEIVNYKWNNGYKEGLFKNVRYYELMVTLPKSKFWDLDNKVKLKVSYDDKGVVDDILQRLAN
ncbi:hypothetical protein [Clostridium aceticum]|nr:hypothetical protein [Clostridium aceticum]